MNHQEIINDLDALIFMADQIKQRCYTTRKKLERLQTPASPKGEPIVSEKVVMRLGKRNSKIQDL
jgi:hypothetical protein